MIVTKRSLLGDAAQRSSRAQEEAASPNVDGLGQVETAARVDGLAGDDGAVGQENGDAACLCGVDFADGEAGGISFGRRREGK